MIAIVRVDYLLFVLAFHPILLLFLRSCCVRVSLLSLRYLVVPRTLQI